MSDKVYEIAGKMLALSELFLELQVIDRDRFANRHLELRSRAIELGILEQVQEVIVDHYLGEFNAEYPETPLAKETNDYA